MNVFEEINMSCFAFIINRIREEYNAITTRKAELLMLENKIKEHILSIENSKREVEKEIQTLIMYKLLYTQKYLSI